MTGGDWRLSLSCDIMTGVSVMRNLEKSMLGRHQEVLGLQWAFRRKGHGWQGPAEGNRQIEAAFCDPNKYFSFMLNENGRLTGGRVRVWFPFVRTLGGVVYGQQEVPPTGVWGQPRVFHGVKEDSGGRRRRRGALR